MSATDPAEPCGILMVAGEPSGDRHGADLARAIYRRLPRARIWGMGGENMARAGVEIVVNMEAVSVVGIVEALGHLAAAYRARTVLLRRLKERRTVFGILVDFPDFNLWLARALKRRGVPLMYYISPQVWAWRKGRLKSMASLLNGAAVILPFEERLLKSAGVNAKYVGHPLIEQVREGESRRDARIALGLEPEEQVLGLLPGSRPREIEYILPVMIEGVRLAGREIPDMKPVLALSPMVSATRVKAMLEGLGLPVRIVEGAPHRVIRASRLALVASGTATLEAALLETPMVVVYRTSWLSYFAGRILVKVDHISLVNLLAGREIVPELIQGGLRPDHLREKILDLWYDGGARKRMVSGFRGIRASLGAQSASQTAARMVEQMLRERLRPAASLPG